MPQFDALCSFPDLLRRLRVLALLTSLGLAPACAASGKVSETTPLAAELANYPVARVEVTSADPDWQQEARVLEGSLVARLGGKTLRVNVGETAFDPQISVEGRRMRPSAGRPDQWQGSSPGGEHGA